MTYILFIIAIWWIPLIMCGAIICQLLHRTWLGIDYIMSIILRRLTCILCEPCELYENEYMVRQIEPYENEYMVHQIEPCTTYKSYKPYKPNKPHKSNKPPKLVKAYKI
jgi:hypothetical protein